MSATELSRHKVEDAAPHNDGQQQTKRTLQMKRAGFLVGLAFIVCASAAHAAGKRVTVTGELIDTWCAVSGIMYGYGSAHHQCAVWCAIGGIPVSISDKDGKAYLILRLEGDGQNASNPAIARFQTHQVTVDGDLVERDGVNYLFVTKIADDKGIVTLNQEEYGVIPFGE
jgi:hypothetical protein